VALDVLILTQDNCGFCDDAKLLFQRLAREFPLSVAMLDINSPEGQKLAVQGGILFPPGIFIHGEPFCYGRPSERKIRREIDTRSASQVGVP
jgi:thiol-disulfide isomerase/thioredoxin